MKNKKILLRFCAVLLSGLLLLAAASFLPTRRVLRITYTKTGELICETKIAPGDKLHFSLQHSFEHVPWDEYYTVLSDNTFYLDYITVGGFGAGIPAEMDVPTYVGDDGLVYMEDIGSIFPYFNWITSSKNMKTLSLNEEVILDFSALPHHSFIHIEIIELRGISL